LRPPSPEALGRGRGEIEKGGGGPFSDSWTAAWRVDEPAGREWGLVGGEKKRDHSEGGKRKGAEFRKGKSMVAGHERRRGV